MASFSCNCCSVDSSSKVASMTSWISGILIKRMSHQACQKVCWFSPDYSKPNKLAPDQAGLTHQEINIDVLNKPNKPNQATHPSGLLSIFPALLFRFSSWIFLT
jgi:hypothetical protein